MTDWRKWLDELENGAKVIKNTCESFGRAPLMNMDANDVLRMVEGYRLLAEAVEAVGRFWEEGIAEAKQAVDRGDLTEDNMDEWFLERFVKSGRDADASEKIQRSLAHLRGVGRD